MSISIRSAHLKDLLIATARNNPKKLFIIVALGGLSAAAAFWLINKYDNKNKKKQSLGELDPATTHQIESVSQETENATTLIMTEQKSVQHPSDSKQQIVVEEVVVKVELEELSKLVSENVEIDDKPETLNIQRESEKQQKDIAACEQEEMASVIQRQNLITAAINELEINTSLDGGLRPQELNLSPTTSTSDKTHKSFEEFPHSPSFNWVEAVDKEMSNRSNTSTNSTEQTNSSEKSENLKQRKSSQPNLKNSSSANNNNSSSNTSLGQRSGYQNAESPSNSEGSADSGRATGGLTSSPFELGDLEIPPMYEFEIPNTLVGLIIGVGGKTIKELCMRANVKMLIRPHHTPAKYETHQICSVEGKRENINKCLHLIKGRFPKERFSDLNLKPVLPPPILPLNPIHQTPTPLTLAVGVPCEVYVSATVDAGHFFTQLPTHPSFSSLQLLDYYMLTVYSTQPNTIPELPKPCTAGCICAAPAYNGWFRAIVLYYYGEQDEALVRYVDYGGYARLPRADLRQIRADFLSLPLQAIECSLAHVQPIDGTSHWSDEANSIFQKLCSAKIIQAELIGTNKHDNLPAVELHVVDENKKVLRVDQVLLENGLAKPADPTRIVKLPIPTSKKSVNAFGDASTNEHTNATTENGLEKASMNA